MTSLEDLVHLLRDTARAHHRAFAETDGEDPDWPQWYAARLRRPLSAALGAELDEAQLAAELARLERERPAGEDWARWYAAPLSRLS